MCSICLENNEENTIKTNCGHKFHPQCLSSWYQDHSDCPYCRQTLSEKLVFEYSKNNHLDLYFFRNLKRKTIKINNIDTSFIYKQLKNNYKFPKCWLKNPSIYPIYEMEWNSKRILISFYLRLYLLYSNKEEVKIIKKRYA